MKPVLPILLTVFAMSLFDATEGWGLPPCPENDETTWTNCEGTYTYADGATYVGDFKDDKFHGQGAYTFEDGSTYLGDFKEGNFNGHGTQTFPDGNTYVGDFKDDKFHGPGTYTWADGTVESGIWENGELVQQIGEKELNEVIEKTVPQPSPNEVIDEQFRVALVIGNGDYVFMGTLRNSTNDARLMTKTLKNLGFEVIEAIDATQKEMKRAVGRFSERLDEGGENSVGLFYYAGHGIQSSGRNYLIPVDARIDREGDVSIESVGADDILRSMEFAEARVNFIILDACRNNPLPRSVRSETRGLARMNSPKGSLIAYATSPGGVAVDGDGDNSPYTLALTAAMMEGDPVERMFRKVRNKVMEATKEMQIPWEASSLIGDDFFFLRKE